MEEYVLTNGVKIPKIGFGCYKLADGGDVYHIVSDAIKVGYRHFDTARGYDNEEEVGRAIRDSGIPRSEFFVTTKLWHFDLDHPEEAMDASLKRLNLDYIDLYLIHWPKPDQSVVDWKELDVASWKVMEKGYQAGNLRAIGVSNFHPHHIQNLTEKCDVVPMVDQLELHPGYMQEYAVKYAKSLGMVVEAWSPLARLRLKEDPLMVALTEKYGVSIQKLCLRYELQRGLLPLPKASSIDRMRANFDVFDFTISQEDMMMISCMPQAGWSGEHPDRVRAERQMS